MELIRKEPRKPALELPLIHRRNEDEWYFRVLAQEAAPYNITVNEVAPGWTISDASREEKEDDACYIKKIPMGRRGN